MSSQLAAAWILGRLALTVAVALVLYLLVYHPLKMRWGATVAKVARPLPDDSI